MPDELDDESSPEDLDDIDDIEEAFDEEMDEDLDHDADEEDLDHDADGVDLDTEELEDGAVDDQDDGAEAAPVAPDAGEHPADDEDDDLDLDEDDVEASLDVILKERLVVPDDVPDDEAPDIEERGEPGEHVLPKQPDEFVCRSCFLVKHPGQLADAEKMLCRDCV